MAREEFAHVSNPRKLADKIGKITGKRPRDVSVWGWVNRERKPVNRKWINSLAQIFKVDFGEEFFL